MFLQAAIFIFPTFSQHRLLFEIKFISTWVSCHYILWCGSKWLIYSTFSGNSEHGHFPKLNVNDKKLRKVWTTQNLMIETQANIRYRIECYNQTEIHNYLIEHHSRVCQTILLPLHRMFQIMLGLISFKLKLGRQVRLSYLNLGF